jgi:hypothetical protein
MTTFKLAIIKKLFSLDIWINTHIIKEDLLFDLAFKMLKHMVENES